MKKTENFDSPYIRKQNIFSFSGEALRELLKSILKRGIPFRVRARGFSMVPFIQNNDVITISPLKNHVLRLGEVVAFIHPDNGKVSVHRVVRKKREGYFIRGDNVSFPDGLIPGNHILGYVSKVERRGRKIHWGFGPERYVIAFFPVVKYQRLFIKFLKRVSSGFKKRERHRG